MKGTYAKLVLILRNAGQEGMRGRGQSLPAKMNLQKMTLWDRTEVEGLHAENLLDRPQGVIEWDHLTELTLIDRLCSKYNLELLGGPTIYINGDGEQREYYLKHLPKKVA